MQHVCSAENCKNNSQDGVKLFRFPKEEQRCREWLTRCGRPSLLDKGLARLYKWARLCEDHFDDSQFMSSRRQKLVWDATPSIFTQHSPTKRSSTLRGRKRSSSDVQNADGHHTKNTSPVPAVRERSPLSREACDSSDYVCRVCNRKFCGSAVLAEHSKVCVPPEAQPSEKARLFTCVLCERAFPSAEELQNHTWSHDKIPPQGGKKPVSCGVCAAQFERPSDLKSHTCRMFGSTKKQFSCPVCRRCFDKKMGLKTHLGTLHRNVELKCAMCSRHFTRNEFIRHFEAYNNNAHVCGVCHRKFCGSAVLAEHRKVCVAPREPHSCQEMFSCVLCGQDFESLLKLQTHTWNHDKPPPRGAESLYTCFLCSKCFSSAHRLQIHIQSHGGEKTSTVTDGKMSVQQETKSPMNVTDVKMDVTPPEQIASLVDRSEDVKEESEQRQNAAENPMVKFHCKTCDMMFFTKEHYSAHAMEHEKKSANRTASNCSRASGHSASTDGQWSGGADLMQNPGDESEPSHQNSGARLMVACAVCGAQFDTLSDLKIHKRLMCVSIQNQFSCGVCRRCFDSHGGLQNHLRSAHRFGELKCKDCDKRFDGPSSFIDHLEAYDNSDYVCRVCNRKFCGSAVLAEHSKVCVPPEPQSSQETRLFTCVLCERAFPSVEELQNHTWSHDKIPPQGGKKCYTCASCDKRFPAPHMLKSHVQRSCRAKKSTVTAGKRAGTREPKSLMNVTDVKMDVTPPEQVARPVGGSGDVKEESEQRKNAAENTMLNFPSDNICFPMEQFSAHAIEHGVRAKRPASICSRVSSNWSSTDGQRSRGADYSVTETLGHEAVKKESEAGDDSNFVVDVNGERGYGTVGTAGGSPAEGQMYELEHSSAGRVVNRSGWNMDYYTGQKASCDQTSSPYAASGVTGSNLNQSLLASGVIEVKPVVEEVCGKGEENRDTVTLGADGQRICADSAMGASVLKVEPMFEDEKDANIWLDNPHRSSLSVEPFVPESFSEGSNVALKDEVKREADDTDSVLQRWVVQ